MGCEILDQKLPVGVVKVGDESSRELTSGLHVTEQTILKCTAVCIGYIIKDMQFNLSRPH